MQLNPRPCAGFDDADEMEQRRMAQEALEKMRLNGFVPLLDFEIL